MTKCVYCKTQLADGSVIDVCDRCGRGVWGEKMFNAIKQSMQGAKDSGDLFQGSVTVDPATKNVKSSAKKTSSFVSDAINQLEKNPENEIKYDSYSKSSLN